MLNSPTLENWIAEHDSFLNRLAERNVIVTFSGGKDSSVVLHFMAEAATRYGYRVQAHGVGFPHHVLNAREQETLSGYWQRRGVPIQWYQSAQGDDTLEKAENQGLSPCLVCNQIKKKAALEHFQSSKDALRDTVVVMGYSLWDLVSASIEHILESVYSVYPSSGAIQGKDLQHRFLETSQRFYPWLPLNGGLTVFRPILRMNDQEITQLINDHKIPITLMLCRYQDFRAKRLFAEYYTKMDLRFDYDKVLAFARSALSLPDISTFESLEQDLYIRTVL